MSEFDKAVRHYASLFTLPSHSAIIANSYLISMAGLSIAFFLIGRNIAQGLIAGFALATASIFADWITFLLVKRDPLFTFRRISGLSLTTLVILASALTAGGAISRIIGSLYTMLGAFTMAFSISAALRFTTFYTCSSLSVPRILITSILHPIVLLFPLLFFQTIILSPKNIVALVLTAFTVLAASYFFLKAIDENAKRAIDVDWERYDPFRAFILDWVLGIKEPLEAFFEKISSKKTVSTTSIVFRKDREPKLLFIVPDFHPGPFKNVGSSAFPHQMQEYLEKDVGVFTVVAHGISDHGSDLASEPEVMKVVKGFKIEGKKDSEGSLATRLIRREFDSSKATCQLFGKGALLTLTRAPKGMEDMPRLLLSRIIKEGKKLGLDPVAIVDAHNSINEDRLSKEDVKNFCKAAVEAMRSSLEERKERFKVGVARVSPKDVTLAQGMGPGGISVIAVKVGKIINTYVIIDGNNMVTGLREKILSDLKTLKIEDGEVMTTDTHAVNAVTITRKGYYPVGEAIDQNKIRGWVKEATRKALFDLERSNAAWQTEKFSGVKVIAEKKLRKLAELVDSSIALMKRAFIVILLIVLSSSIVFTAILS